MLLLRVTDHRGAVTEHLTDSFPYRIGRSPAADLRLDVPGVFEEHAVIALDDSGRYAVSARGSSLLLVNGVQAATAPLRSGDEITLGGSRILVSLAPARQTRLRSTEALVWSILFLVFVAEIALIALIG